VYQLNDEMPGKLFDIFSFLISKDCLSVWLLYCMSSCEFRELHFRGFILYLNEIACLCNVDQNYVLLVMNLFL
jgi:hypothetical protein